MANDNNGWDVDDIDFSEIDFEDLDLDDLDFSIDGDLNSISDERPAASAPVNRPTVSDNRTPARPGTRPSRQAAQPSRPVRKPAKPVYDDDDDDDDEDDRPIRRVQRGNQGKKGGSKAPFIIILCVILGLAVGGILFWIIKGNSKDNDPDTAFSGSGNDTTMSGETGTTAAWSMNTEEKVLDLVNDYYVAMTLADVDTLRTIVDEAETVSEDKVKAEARVVEGYQNISCYTSPGKKDGEYALYVAFEMKFKNINTPAPGLKPFYVRTDNEGNLRLLSWSYIEKNEPEIKSFMENAGNCDAIRELGIRIETDFQNAKATDETLAEFLDSMKKKTTQAAENDTTADVQTTADTQETTPVEEPTGENATTKASGGDDGEESFSAIDTMLYTQENVKARVKPNTSDDTSFTLVKKGTYVQVTGSGNKWYRVCLKDGTTAYIMKQYLADEKPAAEE